MAEMFKIKHLQSKEITEVNTTKMTKYAKDVLKAYHGIGVDKDLKCADISKSKDAWTYLVMMGLGIPEGQKFAHKGGNYKKIPKGFCQACGGMEKLADMKPRMLRGSELRVCERCYNAKEQDIPWMKPPM